MTPVATGFYPERFMVSPVSPLNHLPFFTWEDPQLKDWSHALQGSSATNCETQLLPPSNAMMVY